MEAVFGDAVAREAWAAAPEAPLQQAWAWGAALEAAGTQVLRCELREGGAPVALAQVLLRRAGPLRLALLSRGPVWLGGAGEAQAGAALGALRRALPGGLLVRTGEAPGPAHGLPLMTAAHVAELDLSPQPEALRAGLTAKWRNRLKRAEAAGLRLAREDAAPKRYAWLLEAEAAQARSRRYRGWPPALVPVFQGVAPKRVRVWAAYAKGERVAAMLFLLTGTRATYQIGWSGPAGRESHAHALLLWRAILALREEGMTRLDLGTLDTVTAPGLARFKLGTGAEARPLGQTVLVLPGL